MKRAYLEMEMPVNCHMCLLCIGGCCPSPVCPPEEDGICPDEGRPDWCPLHEVKPHGLIDKARLLNYINDVQFTYAPADGRGNQEEYDFWQRAFEFIEAAPTAIPSDHIRDATKMIEAKEKL